MRNRRVKLGGIGNTVGGRVRRFVLLEVEGMTALTGEGDDAPHAMLSAVGEGTRGSTNVRGGVSRLRHGIGTNVEQDVSSTRGRDAGSGDESDREEYDSRRGMGRLGRSGSIPAQWERLGMSLRRIRMHALLDRLGDRVVDLREAYQSLKAKKAEDYGAENGSHVCCDDLMKLFWTVGVDDAGELVRNYETLLRKEFGEDTSAHLSFDDFLRIL